MQRENRQKRDFSIDFNSLKTDFNRFKKSYKFPIKKLFNLLKEDIYLIPLSIFSKKLSSLETITKYLKEEQNLNFSKIAFLLNRNPRTIWGAYSSAIKKQKPPFKIKKSEFSIPTSALTNRRFSILESIVAYLKEEFSLTYHKIALLLNKDDRTVWTVYSRAKKKRSNAKRS